RRPFLSEKSFPTRRSSDLSVVTVLDGHQMAKQGRAGIALGICAIGSFIAGTVATLIIAALGTPLTKMALLFGPADYFSLMVLGLDRKSTRLNSSHVKISYA